MKVVIEVPGSTPQDAVNWLDWLQDRADTDIKVIGAVDEKYDALVPYIAPPLEA